MGLINSSHQEILREAGWRTRGYLPHFDGRIVPQFITLNLFDAIPGKVIERWERELKKIGDSERRIVLGRRIERYLDQGYGSCFLRDQRIAEIVQNSLLKFDGLRYNLFSWVIMPNHSHFILSRFEDLKIPELLHSHKSFTAHEANKLLNRRGQFWMPDYFDRYIRNKTHFRNTVRYIENNPVKAGLGASPSDWPFSSAWFRAHNQGSEP